MRIAFDGRSLANPVLRGMDRYFIGLAGALGKRGVDVTLFHRSREPLHASHLSDLDVEVVGLPDRGGLWWEQVAVPKEIRRGRFDLFHAPAERGVPLVSPRPVVLTVHSATAHSYVDLVRTGRLPGPISEYLGSKTDPYKWTYPNCYWRFQVARSNHVLTPSGFARDEIIRFLRVKPENVSVTPLAVHEQFTRPLNPSDVRQQTLARLGIGRPYLLYVGGFEPHKNPTGLLRCFSKIHTVRSDMTLVAVGSKKLPPELPALVETLGLKPGVDVQFLVDVTEDMTDLYDEAALFLSISWRESFGLPALEAMSRGTPVVASAWGAGPEVVEEGGILVDPRDEDYAASEVLGMLSHPNPEVLHARAMKAAERFSWDRTAELTLAVYNKLTERGTRRGDAPR